MIKLIILSLAIYGVSGRFVSTPERVSEHGYPVEEYEVETSDGYLLTIFRIPYSPRLNNSDDSEKPVVFLQHGLLCASDSWLLNGPDDSIAFMLADAGYDVWMGNTRGNVYSKKHTKLSTLLSKFWKFSWHEIGVYDLPAMIDFVLEKTQQDKLHYIGHSQGTTSYFVMLSENPSYNDKLKSSHLLAPVAYMNNMKSPLAKVMGPILGTPTLVGNLIGRTEFLPSNVLMNKLGPKLCKEKSLFEPICENVLMLIAGWDSSHFNNTLLPYIMETTPAGSSTRQVLHYLQNFKSARFSKYDFGFLKNRQIYGSSQQPDYDLENIHPSGPINFYYGDNDYLAAVEDVERLADDLDNFGVNVKRYRVSYSDYNHMDFLWAINIREVINDCVVNSINKYENRPYEDMCKHFLNMEDE